MWRFMAITFAFLGWSFYEMSGGSDYAPDANSFQARAVGGDVSPTDVQVAQLDDMDQPVAGADAAVVTRSVASLADLDLTDDSRFQITLASVDATDEYDPTQELETVAVEPEISPIDAAVAAVADAVTAETTAVEGENNVPESVLTGFVGQEVFSLETYVQRQTGDLLEPSDQAGYVSVVGGDVREVTGSSVNMRAGPGTDFEKVGKLSKGTQVAVLEETGNGWVMFEVLETGQTAWMADWLVTASN